MADTKMVVKSKEDMIDRFSGVHNAEYDFTDSTLIDYTYSAINSLTPPQIAKIDAILLTGPSGVGKNVYAEAFADIFGARVYKKDRITIDEDLDRYIFFTCMKSTSADNFFRVPDLDVIVNMQNINVSLKSGIEQTAEAISNHIKSLPLDELFATALEISSGDFVRLQNTVRFAINSEQDASARESFSRIDRLTGAAIEAQKKKTGTSKALQDGAFRRAVKLANEGKNVVLHVDELDKDESGYAQQAIAGLLSSALITDGTKNGTLRLEEHAYSRLKVILTQNYNGEQIVPHLQDRLPFTVNLNFTERSKLEDLLKRKLRINPQTPSNINGRVDCFDPTLMKLLMVVYERIITDHSPLWSFFGGKKPENGKKVSSIPSARRFMMGLYHDYINHKSGAISGERLDKIFPIVFETADTRDVKIFIDIFDELKIGHLLPNTKKKYKGEG